MLFKEQLSMQLFKNDEISMQNILIFGHSYGPQFIDVNNQYTQLFDKKKYGVTIVYLIGEPDEAIRQKHTADEVIFLNCKSKETRGLKISTIKKMLKLTREKSFHKVICHRYKPSYIMMWVSLFYKIPELFFVMHELGTVNSFARKLLIATLAKPNMIFAGVSNAVRDDIRQSIWKVPHRRVITLYNTIDVPFTENLLLDRETARAQLNLPTEAFVFGNMGRLVKNKDHTTLIRAFSLIEQQCPHAILVIAGIGPHEQELKKLIEELGVKNKIIFLGFLQEGFRYMKAFDVYVSSSIQEAFGRVLLEAMIAHVPIIATHVHGVPEVVGDAGTLIPMQNPQSMANEFIRVYQLDTAAREAWGKKGYLRARESFSHEGFGQKFWAASTLE